MGVVRREDRKGGIQGGRDRRRERESVDRAGENTENTNKEGPSAMKGTVVC